MKNFNKHFLATLGLGLLATAAHAQQGVGTTGAPRTMLDVNGAISVTETTAAVASNAATVPTGFSLVRLTGTATASVTLTAATSPAPVAGQQLTIYNTTTFPATFASQTIAAGTSLGFVYSNGGWRATAGGGNAATTNTLNSTGNTISSTVNGVTDTAPAVNSVANTVSGNTLSTAVNGVAGTAVTVPNLYTADGTLAGARTVTQGSNALTFAGAGNLIKTGGNVGIGTTTPAATLDINGSLAPNYRQVTASATLLSTDFYVVYNGTAAGTLTLPTGVGVKGRLFTIKNTTAAQTVTLNAPTGEGIDGSTSLTISAGQSVQLVTSGATAAGTATYEVVAFNSATAAGAVAANNGLSVSGNTVQLGGALTKATSVSGITATNTLSFTSPTAADAAITVGTSTGGGGSGKVYLGNANHGIQRDLTGSASVLDGTTAGNANDVAVYTSVPTGTATTAAASPKLFLAVNPPAPSGSTGLPLGQFTLNGAGYVGIGTPNPGAKLQVVTTGGSGGADDDYIYDTYTGTSLSASGIYYRHARGTASAPTNLAANDLIYTQSGMGYINGAFRQTSFFDTYYVGDGTTNQSFMRFGTSGAEQMRIDKDGNVGMGTAAPALNLDVVGTSGSPVFGVRNAAAYDHLYITNDGFGPALYAGGAETGIKFNVGSSATGTYGDASQNYREVMRMLPNGNVGMGTATPLARFNVNSDNSGDINDNVAISSYNSSDYPGFQLISAAGTQAAPQPLAAGKLMGAFEFQAYRSNGTGFGVASAIQGAYQGDGTTLASDLRFLTGNGERMRIDQTGNVGIGTGTPAAKLDVNGNARIATLATGAATDQVVTYNATTGLLNQRTAASLAADGGAVTTASNGLTKTGNDVQLGGTLTKDTNIATAGNDLTITGTGKVGIGTTAPITQLANTSINILGTDNQGINPGSLTWAAGQNGYVGAFYNSQTTTAGNGLAVKVAGTLATTTALDVSTGTAQATAGTSLLSVKGNGYLGLGTSAPAVKIHSVTTGGTGQQDDDFYYDTYTGNVGVSGLGLYYRHARGTLAAPANLANGDLLLLNNQIGYINGAFMNSVFQTAYYVGDGTTNLSYMTFGTSGGEKVRIDQNGNLGIGSTAPAAKLDVNGNARIATLATGAATDQVVTYNATTGLLNQRTAASLAADGGAVTTASNGLTKTTANNVALGGTLSTNTVIGTTTNTLAVSGNNASTTFGTNGGVVMGGTGVQRLEFTSSGDPNAAIGHTSRSEGTSTEINDLYLYSGDSFNDNSTYGPDRIRVVAPSILFQSINANGGGNTLANAESNTGTTTNMVINGANGNVGIGTATPLTSLSITPNATASKITLYDNGSTTVHYGFGISANQLNYDVLNGASHVFYVNSKNGSGTEVLRANGAAVTTSVPLNVNGTFNLGVNGTNLNAIVRASAVAPAAAIPVAVSGATTATANFTVANAVVAGSIVNVSPTAALPNGVSIAYARVSAAGTVTVGFVNASATAQTIPTTTTFNIIVTQ